MLRKDYLQRQFEEFGRVLAQILGFKKSGDMINFEKEIESAVKTFTSLELDELLKMNLETFEKMVKTNETLRPDQIRMLADLFYERSFVFDKPEQTEQMKDMLSRAYFLYKRYTDELTANEFNLEVSYRIRMITEIIHQPNLQ
jgi:SPX domain protein involved in polyphosphate accumulation